MFNQILFIKSFNFIIIWYCFDLSHLSDNSRDNHEKSQKSRQKVHYVNYGIILVPVLLSFDH